MTKSFLFPGCLVLLREIDEQKFCWAQRESRTQIVKALNCVCEVKVLYYRCGVCFIRTLRTCVHACAAFRNAGPQLGAQSNISIIFFCIIILLIRVGSAAGGAFVSARLWVHRGTCVWNCSRRLGKAVVVCFFRPYALGDGVVLVKQPQLRQKNKKCLLVFSNHKWTAVSN